MKKERNKTEHMLMLHISFSLAFSLSLLTGLSFSLTLSLFFASLSLSPLFAPEEIQLFRSHSITKIWISLCLCCLHYFCFGNFFLLSTPFVYFSGYLLLNVPYSP